MSKTRICWRTTLTAAVATLSSVGQLRPGVLDAGAEFVLAHDAWA